ncbi:NHL repeat-containing protein [Botrimarina hoheduenensis]|uniref:Serine/threonine-protein kinase PknD n=1 Tax=Botrimarina hoheduenensis TaxID=2528000 RepID=A0A5C5WBY3_9BACT|nr:NHL repeat-containing protein [Botrimarina hoheduenensis]TWT47589.1 Serine/threonine-protein kinase PknD [Botrimarina hoheduenensis]
MTPPDRPPLDRRRFCQAASAAAGLGGWSLLGGAGLFGGAGLALSGCGPAAAEKGFGRLEAVWGRRGIVEGRMSKPRAIAIDPQDQLYIVDFTARILVFDDQGNFLRSWQTPESTNGRPTGLTFDASRNELLVADTHYYRVLFYTPAGELLTDRTVGGVNGKGPGEFGFVTDAVRDSTGCLYVSEYGDNDRVQKFSPDGEYLLGWGSHGSEPGQFRRPQNLVIDPQDRIWVCDACNHRLQLFDPQGELIGLWGTEGSDEGQLYYPYDMALDPDGNFYVCEYGNHRLQKFSPAGVPLGVWGGQGREPGQLWDPWALVRDSRGRLHVLDTGNHRVQRIAV